MGEEAVAILREWGFGALSLLIVLFVLYRLDRQYHAFESHVRADEQFHREILKGQADLVERIENVRLAGETHASEAATGRRNIHQDVGKVGERLATLEGRFEERRT